MLRFLCVAVTAGLLFSAEKLSSHRELDRFIEFCQKARRRARLAVEYKTEKWMAEIERAMTPQTPAVKFPSPEKWKELTEGASARLLRIIAEERDCEWRKEIEKKLREILPPLDFESLQLLQKLAGVNIVLDSEILKSGEPTVILEVKDMSFRSALDWICQLYDLKYNLINHAIYITP